MPCNMASKTHCMNYQNADVLCGGNTLYNQSEYRGNSASEGTNGTACYEDVHLEQKHIISRIDGPRHSKRTRRDVSENLANNDRPLVRIPDNADEGTRLYGNHGIIERCLEVSEENLRQQEGNTLHDLYMQEYDDKDDDDSDWEPVDHSVIKKWFCINCTMPNFEDYCNGCGEHKDSEISSYNLQQDQLPFDSRAVHRNQEPLSRISTAIGFDERMLLHSEAEMKSHPHPERSDRLRAIAASLATAGLFPGKCSAIPAREINREELELVHSIDHIESVHYTSRMFSSYFTPDTYANEHSACAARIAAGLCADLAHSIMSGDTLNGFALVRPPGHHAGVNQSMGFCLHNNAAIAALASQKAGAKKVLIVDWDVHHGNGTQEIFNGNKSVLYISLHRHEDGSFYPGTGAANEVGIMDGRGYSVNIPWSCGGVGDNDYIFAFEHIVLPIASEFAPDITIVSAGFDAARGDPLGCCDYINVKGNIRFAHAITIVPPGFYAARVTPAGYAQMTHMLTALSQGKLLVILEGGYNLLSISSSALAVVKVLLGENPSYQMSNVMPSHAGLQTVLQVMQIQLEYWPILQSGYILLRTQWNKRNEAKKRKHLVGPFWWKWGSKKIMYELLYGSRRGGARKHAKMFR